MKIQFLRQHILGHPTIIEITSLEQLAVKMEREFILPSQLEPFLSITYRLDILNMSCGQT